jgi:RNA polymerase sigma-70 factor (ECF subfamily)
LEALKAAVETNGAELVRRARAGDGVAWEEIVQAFSRRIFNLAYRFTSNPDAAEDLTQEVFIRIYRTLDQYDSKQGDLANWLMRLARNLIIDDYRHRQPAPFARVPHRSFPLQPLMLPNARLSARNAVTARLVNASLR